MRDLLELYQRGEKGGYLAEVRRLAMPILKELADKLGYERLFVALVDENESLLEGAVGLHVPLDLLETLQVRLDGTPGPLVQSLLLGKPQRVDNALLDPRVPDMMRALYDELGMLSFAALPLLPAVGVLVVSKNRPVTGAETEALLPYAARLASLVAERVQARHVREFGEQQGVDKEWLKWMLNTVQDPVVLSDERNEVLLQNASSERLFKSSVDDSPGKRRAIQLNNFLFSAALSSFALDPASSYGRELTLVDPIEGDELLFEVICQPATNLRSGERGLVSVLKDVTDLRRATDELRRSLEELRTAGEQARSERDRLNLMVENVADPIVVTDPASEIILMNPPAERLLQPREGEPGGREVAVCLINDAKLTSFLSELRLEAAQVRRGEIQLVDPDSDQPLMMSVTATKVQDQLGRTTAIVSVLHDLSEIRELEQRRVQEQLFESEKLAAVGRLAATVAHEINNPLEAIKNSLYLLVSRTPQDDPNRRFVEIASKETERVSAVIRQMLGFYRPAATMAPTDTNKVLEEAIALLDRQVRQRHVIVHCDLAGDLPPILASADQLKQVFLNLILNAKEAMPDGGELHVSTRISQDGDAEFLAARCVLVQLRDTGTGIREDHLRHIFEPFFSTKHEQHGTGLGLWVSQEIVQQHGGQIKVRSRPGRGTTFTVALPLGA